MSFGRHLIYWLGPTAAYLLGVDTEYITWYVGCVVAYVAVEILIRLWQESQLILFRLRLRYATWKRAAAQRIAELKTEREWRRKSELERLKREQNPVPEDAEPVADTPEEKLRRLEQQIDASFAAPDVKLKLKAQAKKAYEEEVSKAFKW